MKPAIEQQKKKIDTKKDRFNEESRYGVLIGFGCGVKIFEVWDLSQEMV